MTQTGAPLLLFYGGTFDPVHHGHLDIARHARDALGCSVRLMPAADPPHRATPGADAVHRAAMLELAVAGAPGLEVDRCELERDGPSYTVDTLRALRDTCGPDVPLALLLGADSLLGLPGWHQWRALFDLAHLVVAERPGSTLDGRLPDELAEATQGRWTDAPPVLRSRPAGRVLRLRQPLHPGSATAVRAAIAADAAWRGLVPPTVAEYILRHRLYGVHGAPTPPPV